MEGTGTSDAAGAADGVSLPARSRGGLSRLAWLPIPAVIVAMACVWAADLRFATPVPSLFWLIHYGPVALAFVFIFIPAAYSFLRNGQPSLLMLGCGVLMTNIGASAMPTGFLRDSSTAFAIYNTSALLSAMCHFIGVGITVRRMKPVARPVLWLTVGLGACTGAMVLVVWLALTGRMPLFFIEGQGGTPLRTVAVVTAVAFFLLTAGLLLQANRRTPSPFLFWYALGLILLAAGLGGSTLIVVRDSPLQWVTRLGQVIGTIYMCVAVLATWHRSTVRPIPLEAEDTARRTWAPWAPVAILAVTMCVLWPTREHGAWGPSWILPQFNAVFAPLVSLLVAFLAAWSVLVGGRRSVSLLGGGMLAYAAASVGGGISAAIGHMAEGVAVFNTGACVSGGANLAGAIMLLASAGGRGEWTRRGALWTCYLAAFGAICIVAACAYCGLMPPFFADQSPTTVRYAVLGATIAQFAGASVVLVVVSRRRRSGFLRMYAQGLALIAMGFAGVMAIRTMGSPMGWAGTGAMFLGLGYLLVAGLRAVGQRERRAPVLSLGQAVMEARYRYGVAIAVVLAATVIRLLFLSSLGTRVAFLTFYPAVILAALYGGLWPGLLATALAGGMVTFLWNEPVGRFSSGHPVDWLAIGVFVMSCTMISLVTEAMHRARAKAASSETEARFADDRAATAEALHESEERYRTLFDTMTEGFALHEIILDDQGRPCDYRFIEVNPAFERLTGLCRDNLVGKRVREVMPGTESKWIEEYGKVALTGKPLQMENYSAPLNRWYEVFSYRTSPGRFAVVFSDITGRKRTEEALRLSEERFAKAFTGNAAAIAMTRLEDGLFMDVNDTWVALNGYAREEVIGRSARTMHIWPSPDAAKRFVDELKDKGIVRGWIQEFSRKSGEVFVAELSATMLTVEGEKVILTTMVDITDRRRAEETLRQAMEDLNRSNHDLEQFAYIASHDLQEPLRQVRSFVGMLRDRHAGKLDGAAAEYMQFIHEGAARMSDLVSGLLAYSRVGARQGRPQSVSLCASLDTAVANLQTAIAESHARITHDDLPTVTADATQVTQLLQNLIGNAIKFRRDGVAPEIHVGCRRDGDGWVFSVSDNGIGIAPAYNEKVFQIFQRLHGRDKYSGTGIGLAICKKIVEQHGGSIWIESKLGEGAAFKFTLPQATRA